MLQRYKIYLNGCNITTFLKIFHSFFFKNDFAARLRCLCQTFAVGMELEAYYERHDFHVKGGMHYFRAQKQMKYDESVFCFILKMN